MGDELDAIAVHEAAHAVAAIALLGPAETDVRSVSAMGVGGWARVLMSLEPGDTRAAVIALAGPEAARLAGDARPYLSGAADAGDALAVAILSGASPALDVTGAARDSAPLLALFRRQAAEFVVRFWPEIAAGARALTAARGRTMTGREFAAAAGGRVRWYSVQPSAPVLDGDGFTSVTACSVCGLTIPIPRRSAVHLTADELERWAAAVAGVTGCRCAGAANGHE